MFKVKTFIDIVGADLDNKINSAVEEIEADGGIIRDIKTQIYGAAAEKIIVIIMYIVNANFITSKKIDMEEEFEPVFLNEPYTLDDDLVLTFPPEWTDKIASIPQ